MLHRPLLLHIASESKNEIQFSVTIGEANKTKKSVDKAASDGSQIKL